jgi:5'-deoxynucleotidase YfbR-like HD superfamily hydrolase
MERIGDWIQVYSGRPFWPLDPRAEEVEIEDIAQALSLKCRYGGHCLRFYSVAEHSVLVSQHVAPEHALWALLHDAGEAYLADVPRPVKPSLAGWKALEDGIMRAVCDRFGLPHAEPGEVKRVDFAITTDEKAALMAEGPAWTGLLPPIGARIEGLPPMEARAAFMARFEELRHES